MPVKYVPFIPEPIEGQAVLGNFNRILYRRKEWVLSGNPHSSHYIYGSNL